MYKNLNPVLIDASGSLEELTQQAKIAHFEGMDIDIVDIANQTGNKSVSRIKDAFGKNGLQFGGWYLPTRWKDAEDVFKQDLEQLSSHGLSAKKLGCTCATTWISSYSDELAYEQNLEWHEGRLTAIAEVLEKNDCKLALEYVGTESFRTGHKYEFIHDLQGLMKLVDSMGMRNIGLLIDSWHWYVSGGTIEDLSQLTSQDVFYVHINDAPKNKELSEQVDLCRCLPGETGVIDIVGFLYWLKDINFKGPVTPEPFSEKTKGLTASAAIQLVGEAVDKVWKKAGLS